MIKPISPTEHSKFRGGFPDFVFEAFNRKISEVRSTSTIRVSQNEVIALIEALGNVTRSEIFANNWLDVEEHYQDAGWVVTYNKSPCWSDMESYFEFSTTN